MFLQILTLLGALALFVFGMEMLSAGIQKTFGEKLRRFEKWMQSDRTAKQILAGAGITAVEQSSSAATLVVVSLVSAATLTLVQGISVIMGVNIGTTITAWLLALLGFPIEISSIAFIVVGAAFVMSLLKKSRIRNLGQALMGLALVLVGIIYMRNSIPAIGEAPQMAEFFAGLSSHGFGSVLIFLSAGILLSFLLQSSSVSVVLTMVLVYLEWIPFGLGAAMVLGENIGTTLTPYFAAKDAGVQARRTALAHMVFNISGAVLLLFVFGIFTDFCLRIVSLFGLDAPLTAVFGIACAHTLFNVFSTLVLTWFRNPFARFLTRRIKEDEPDKGEFRLRYIGSGRIIGTPSISIEQAYKECVNDAVTAQEGFRNVKLALNEKDADKFEEYRSKLVHCEEVTDKFEYEIADFLTRIQTEQVSEKESNEIKVLYRVIGELESLGDSCENISRLLVRLRLHNLEFDEDSLGKLNLLVGLVDKAFTVMLSNLKLAAEGSLTDISNAYNAEDNINETRNAFRDEGIFKIEKESERFLVINYFLDMLAELEAMGDFIINVSQSLIHEFDK